MQIDLILDARASDTELADLGQLAEELGFAGIWVSTLLDGRDPFTNLTMLARSTSRIAMGPIAVNPWDTHPVKIAGALHTLNEISNGRARIVIGGGGEALASLGLTADRRVRAVRECMDILHLASTGELSNYAGELYRVNNYRLGWLKATPPSLYVGANMPQMLRMAGKVADGVMLSDLPPRLAGNALGTAREACADAGRDAAALWFSSFTAWHVYTDEQQARNEAKRWLLLRGLFRPWVLEEFLDPAEVELIMQSEAAFLRAFLSGSHEIEGVPATLADKLVDELSLTASVAHADKLVEEIRGYRDAGLTSLSLRLYEQPDVSMRLLAERVLPQL